MREIVESLPIGMVLNLVVFEKLIPILGDKMKYVVHYKNVKHNLSLGMKLVKIHRILSFKQSNWLKSYVDFNTEESKKSTDQFYQNL